MAAVWGIDVGKSALKAVKLRRTKEGLEIKAIEHHPYSIEEEEDQRNEQVADALRSFLVKHKIGSDRIVVGIPGLHAFSRFIKLPPVDRGKLIDMVRMEAQQQIPFPIAEVNWDWLKIEREYAPGEEFEVGLFATRSELIDGFLGDLKAAKLTPDIVTIAPLAIYNFMRFNQEPQEGATIVLDIGSEHTDLVIIDGERFWLRNLRIAGNDITKALAERFKVPFAEAEKLKRNAAKSDQAKKIFSAMESVLKDLVGEVHRSVGFFKSQAEDLEVKRMVLLGDGARLKNVTKYLSEQLGYEVDRVGQLEQDKFIIDPDVDQDMLKNHLLGFGVAFGLAIQGVESAKVSINLAPQDLQINSQLKNKLPWAMGAAALSWLALVLGYLSWSMATAQLAGAVSQTSKIKEYKQVQEDAAAVKSVEDLELQAAAFTSLGKGRTFMLQLMEQLEAVLPRDNSKIPDLYSRDPKLYEKPLPQQNAAYNQALQAERTNAEKLWILNLKIDERPPAANPEPGAPEARGYRVEMSCAIYADNVNQAAAAGQARQRIKDVVAKPLSIRLADAPYHLRDSEQEPTKGYGEVFVSTARILYGLHPARTSDRGGGFTVYVVDLKFDVGVPPPPPPPAAPPPAPEGE